MYLSVLSLVLLLCLPSSRINGRRNKIRVGLSRREGSRRFSSFVRIKSKVQICNPESLGKKNDFELKRCRTVRYSDAAEKTNAEPVSRRLRGCFHPRLRRYAGMVLLRIIPMLPRDRTRTRRRKISPWGRIRGTRKRDYHRSIDTEVRSSGGGQTGGGMMMTQSGGYFGRGDYEEEEEELEDEEDGTQGMNTQRSSYNSAMQTQSTTAGGSGGGHMVRSSLQSGGSMTPPQATSPNPNNPGRTSTSSRENAGLRGEL